MTQTLETLVVAVTPEIIAQPGLTPAIMAEAVITSILPRPF